MANVTRLYLDPQGEVRTVRTRKPVHFTAPGWVGLGKTPETDPMEAYCEGYRRALRYMAAHPEYKPEQPE